MKQTAVEWLMTDYSCGSDNSWIGNQVNVQRFILKDTLVTKVLSVDCQ